MATAVTSQRLEEYSQREVWGEAEGDSWLLLPPSRMIMLWPLVTKQVRAADTRSRSWMVPPQSSEVKGVRDTLLSRCQVPSGVRRWTTEPKKQRCHGHLA